MLSSKVHSLKYVGKHLACTQQFIHLGRNTYNQYYLMHDNQKREFMTTPPRQGLIGAVFLIGGLSWSYNYLKRESYLRNGMIPPPSSGLLGQTLKTFFFAATLPITLPFALYKFIKGDVAFFNKWDPFDFSKNQQQYYYQDRRYEQPYENTQYQSNQGYGRRMEWRHIPGFGWQYVEVEYGPQDNFYESSHFYEDFEDFFQNGQRQQQQQQQQQSWNYEDIFGNHSGMTKQEAYKVLGLQPNASKQDIQLAHKKMLMKHHPDHGGSTEMASKINQARDVLLGRK